MQVSAPDEEHTGWRFEGNGIIIDDADEVIKFSDLYSLAILIKSQSMSHTAETPISLLAWTTTPWTLPANLALVVHPDLWYVQVYDIAHQQIYILAEELLSKIYKNAAEYAVIYR